MSWHHYRVGGQIEETVGDAVDDVVKRLGAGGFPGAAGKQRVASEDVRGCARAFSWEDETRGSGSVAGGVDAAEGDFADLEDVVLRDVDGIAVASFIGDGVCVICADADWSLELVGDYVETLEMIPVVVGDEDGVYVGLPCGGDQLVRLVRCVDDDAFI